MATVRYTHDINIQGTGKDAPAVTKSWWCGLVNLKTMKDFCASHGVSISWTGNDCLLRFPDGSTAKGTK
ncbi:MAG: hypothetical protein ACK5YK_01805, partial [Pseudomonadota bacterium]